MRGRYRRAFLRATVAAVAVTLGGCAGLHAPLVNDYATDAGPFKISGVMVVTSGDGRVRKFGFVWRRESVGGGGVADVVTLRDAAGVARARVRADLSGAELVMPDNTVRADDARALMMRVLNVPLPLRALGDFLGGEVNSARSLREKMRQLQWHVREDIRDDDGLPLRFGIAGAEGGALIIINRRRQ